MKLYLTSVWSSELTWILHGRREILGFSVWIKSISVLVWRHRSRLDLKWGSIWLDFTSGVAINTIFVRGFEFDLGLVWESKVTCFLCGGRKFIACGTKSTRFVCTGHLICFLCGWWWWGLSWFLDAGRKSLGFSVSIGMDLVFVWVADVDLISACGIELDLISVQGSELICLCLGV